MKHLYLISSLFSLMLLSACSGETRKVVVMASGNIQINGNTVTLEPGTTHNEANFEPSGDSIIVVSPSGNNGYSLKETGLYILNLKTDTLVGSYQRTGTDNSREVINLNDLRYRIDSLYRLVQGLNVSAEGRNYNIPPMELAKITANTKAEIIGPYVSMPNSFDPSKEHEVYKFYTAKETWDIILRLIKMVQAKPKPQS